MGLDNPLHIAILLLIVLLVFGARRLPELGRSLGEGMRGFKDAITGDSSRDREAPQAAPAAPTDREIGARPAEPASKPSEPPVGVDRSAQEPTRTAEHS
ncbi:MAG TPA: twin-arginine translocase TatA/TatE family subunit [Solirubrobacteraceae bacterium]|jgi:sec-independent protein translocase protein TatA|nr:twin-arginine translocase TatA/TatE family subunit [Solirubrobacteraceae bacterium]